MSPGGAAAPLEWANAAQREAFIAGPSPVCASGGWGSSKTYAFALKALFLSDHYPRNRGLIFRRVAKELRATTMATFRKLCPEGFYESWNQQDGLLRLHNGSEILWMHMEDPDVANVIRGLEINWFFGDQAEEIEEEIFDLLLARLGRWDQATVPEAVIAQHVAATGTPWPWVHPTTGRPIPPTYAMLACNPDTDLHWIYNRFHPESPEWQERWAKRGYRMIFFDSMSNKFLPEQNKQALREMREDLARRYVKGLWGIPEGLIHNVPAESVLTFTRYEEAQAFLDHLRATCSLFRVLDHGDTSPTCCLWFAVDRDGNAFCYREYCQGEKLVSHHRERVFELSERESYTWNLADPSIFHKGTGGQKRGQFWTVADEWSDRIELPDATAVAWAPGDNNELGTRNRINEYLRVRPERVHPVTKEKGAPRLFFLARTEAYPHGCVHAIRQTRAQKRLQVTTAGGSKLWSDERDPEIVDHAYDPVRYFIASRPPIAAEPTRQAASNTFFGKQRQLAKQLARRQR